MFARFFNAQMDSIGRHLFLGPGADDQPCSTRNTALLAICRSRSRGPIFAISCQLLATSASFSEPSATSDASRARSGPNRSSASEVKYEKLWMRALGCSAKSRKLIEVGSPEEFPKIT